MSYFENRLAMSCKQMGEASAELLEWIDDNADLVGAERISLLRDFYRSGQSAQRLAAAVNTMTCVAVVGSRRSGKTQLVSSLVERGNAALSLRFDGIQDNIAFARQIVPEGSRLGASAVIRLSAKARPAPQNFPISVRLTSLADLIKIVGSAYIKAVPERREGLPGVIAVRDALQSALDRLGPAPVAGLREDDVWEVRDYFAARFVDEPSFGILAAAGFWEFLAENCTRLTNADRARLLSFVWGGLPALTSLFEQLADALGRLGFGREASCALDAILGLDQRTGRFTRRVDSILSAQTITGLADEGTEAIVVRTELGQWVSLTRPVLAALVTEVRLPVRGYSSELLEKADVLEMPGIEPREPVPGLARAIEGDAMLTAQLFMKAKAVMLLERYAADSEITSLVLCVDPSIRKLGELPRLVGDWVERTHGADPTEREPHDNGLFVVFTKLDRELTDPVRRGERRIDLGGRIASILRDDLGREHNWPGAWTPGRKFDNVHLVRSAGTKLKHLCEYDAQGRETGYRSTVLERIERARLDFLDSEAARTHVADPGSAWSEAMELNDGGITYLAQSIGDVCDTSVKHRQVLSTLTGLRQAMKDRLQRYYVSDNQAVQQSRRHGAALLVVRRIRQCAEGERLGALVRALQVPESEIADVLVNLAALRGHAAGAVPDGEPAEPAAFARAAVTHWIEQMRTGAGAINASRRFMLPPAVLASLVDELIVGAARIDLEGTIANRIETSTAGETALDRRVAVAAMCAAGVIGEYVMWLGFTDSRSNSRPRRKGKREIPIFPPRPAVDLSRLAEAEAASEDRFFADWSQAFTMLVAENAAALREGDLNADENRRLGQLLMLLDTTI